MAEIIYFGTNGESGHYPIGIGMEIRHGYVLVMVAWNLCLHLSLIRLMVVGEIIIKVVNA